MNEVNPEDYPPHLQWATDPAGRRYWVQGGPSFGSNPLASLVTGLLGSRTRAKTQVGGVVMVTRVHGEERVEVFEAHYDAFEKARAKAVALVEEIEAGTFTEQHDG